VSLTSHLLLLLRRSRGSRQTLRIMSDVLNGEGKLVDDVPLEEFRNRFHLRPSDSHAQREHSALVPTDHSGDVR